mgnify:CR=1 FL=1
MIAKIMFGIHAANIGGVSALIANVDDTVCSMIYPKLRAKPMPRYIPIPPFLFLDERDNPMTVRIKEEKDMAILL